MPYITSHSSRCRGISVKYMKKVITSNNKIKILFLWVDSDGPPYNMPFGTDKFEGRIRIISAKIRNSMFRTF